MRRLRALLPFMVAAYIGGCVEGTETTNPQRLGLHGRLVDGSGNPVASARVKAVPAGNSPVGAGAATGDSVFTDKSGKFAFGALGAGRFNLLGDHGNGSLVVLIPDVRYPGQKADVDLGTDTLRAPGQIKGETRLEGQGIAGIFCYLPGTSLISISDGTGEFRITGVPKGIYEVKYSYPGLRTATDSGVVVRPGETTVLPPKELGYDTAYPPPPPGRLGISYDTLAGAVVLTWNRPRVEDLDGFVVYRIDSATSTPVRINAGLIRDTLYRDTVFGNPDTQGRRTVTYRIKSQDSALNLSSVYSPAAAITALAPASVRTRFTFRWSGPEGSDITIGDTARIIATWSNPTFRHRGFSWYQEGHTEPLREVGGDFPQAGEDTLLWSWGDSSVIGLRIRGRTEAGHAWDGDTVLPVRLAAPTAIAGMEAVIEAGKTAVFTGRGVDPIGRIVEYAWDMNGDGVFEKVSAVAEDVRTVLTAGQKKVVFRVTDDDGNQASDTLEFLVGNGFGGDVIDHDMVFTKAGGPYFFPRKVLIPEGIKVTVEPGALLRFGHGGYFRIEGTLYAVGTSKDSIRVLVDSIPIEDTAVTVHNAAFDFMRGSGTRMADTVYQSGSLLRFVTFRGHRTVAMTNALVTMEDCSQGKTTNYMQGPAYGMVLTLDEPVNGTWLFRRNRFPMACLWTKVNAPFRLDAYFQGNTIGNDGTLRDPTTLKWPKGFFIRHWRTKPTGTFLVERNVFRGDSLLKGLDGDAGFHVIAPSLDSNGKLVVRENTFRTNGGLGITGVMKIDISKNDFLFCTGSFSQNRAQVTEFPEDEPADGPTRLAGRVHHNRVYQGDLGLGGEAAGLRVDSNHFDLPVRIKSDSARGYDFRGNYWSTNDTKAIANRITDYEDRPTPGIAQILPILTAPPPGAGRTKP